MSAAAIPARSIALLETWTARSTGEKDFSFPPKVPNGVRTAERKTTPEVSEERDIALKDLRLLPAVDAELPDRIELSPASSAMFCREVLSAMRAVCHRAAFRQHAAAESASLVRFHRRQAGHGERSGRLAGGAAVAIAAVGAANRVAASVLRRNRDAEFLECVGRERDARIGVITKSTEVGVRRSHLLLQSLLHRLVGPYIALLTREQPTDRC